MDNPPLSEDDLVSLAEQHGFSVTPRQIERWRKADLLPRPTQVHPDFAITRTEYPPETANQLLAVCRFLKVDRRFDRVAMMLFFEGFAMPLTALSEAIDSIVLRGMNQLRKTKGTDEIAEDIACKLSIQPLKSRALKRMRKRVGSIGDFETMIINFSTLLLDPSPDSGKSESEQAKTGNLIAKAMAFQRASTDRVGDAGPWFHGQFGTELKTMKEYGILSFDALHNALQTATIEELEQARADLDSMRLLKHFAQIVQMFQGEGAFGVTIFADAEMNDVEDKTTVLLHMLHLRKAGLGVGIDELTASLRRFQVATT